MTSLEFAKMNGIGNSFILMDDTDGQISGTTCVTELAKRVCNVHFGIGGDGLILVQRSQERLRMRIFNADGSEAEMCGNGMRCFAQYVICRGLVSTRDMAVETAAGTIGVTVEDEGRISLDMGRPVFAGPDIATATAENDVARVCIDEREYRFVSMGNPHAIAYVEDFDFPWRDMGATVEMCRHHFPHRTNVEFARVDSDGSVTMKVWERGCGETLACGTGACAVVVAGVMGGELPAGTTRVHLAGGDLLIDYRPGSTVRLTGTATHVCSGMYDVKA